MSVAKKLQTIEKIKQKLQVKEEILLKKAISSSSPTDIIYAQKTLENITKRQENSRKSFLVDPLDFYSNFGYKDKPFSLSYSTLKSMSKTPIINAIIKTRKNQIADFAEPQADKYSTGFTIKKKKRPGQKDEENTAEDWAKIEYIQDFIINCGRDQSWEADDFETFVRKIIDDSLTYDQMTFEIVRDHAGDLYEFFATDASTFRIADSYDDDDYKNRKDEAEEIQGYYPSYVQIYNNEIVAEFYPWELVFGIRNPSTSIFNVGYGVSELEELISTVTSMLWAEEYNKRFFSQGSAPKGLLRVKGSVNEKQLSAFRQEWQAMITGVQQAWKTPIVDADIDWIDLQKNNRDMEYSAWMEYLIKISSAIFSIDPNEIGFSINQSNGQKSMFESNNEGRLKHSKDKGLYPILKFLQRKINKYLISQIDNRFEFNFVGLNGLTIAEELEIEIKRLSNFQTLNETRAKFGMEEVENGDIILNPTYTQQLMMQQQNMSMDGMMGEDVNPFLIDDDEDYDENPFLKSFVNNLRK
jgi:HK97 family phage portal protein